MKWKGRRQSTNVIDSRAADEKHKQARARKKQVVATRQRKTPNPIHSKRHSRALTKARRDFYEQAARDLSEESSEELSERFEHRVKRGDYYP